MRFFFLLFLVLNLKVQSQTYLTKNTSLVIYNSETLLPDGTLQLSNIYIEKDKIAAIEKLNQKVNLKAKNNSKIEFIDANGQFVMPGFIDAHLHLMMLGKYQYELNFAETHSWESIVEMVKNKVKNAKKEAWITGLGWHQEKWNFTDFEQVEGFPTNAKLNEISPENPVILYHASGHSLIANQKAMDLAGINSNTNSPKGGTILKDKSGKPTGVFLENAMELIDNAYNNYLSNLSKKEKKQQWGNFFDLAVQECLSYGITTVHDAGLSFSDAEHFYQKTRKNKLPIRIYGFMLVEDLKHIQKEKFQKLIKKTQGNPFFNYQGVKVFLDGALGSRGAWFLEDYSDMPGYKGENLISIDSLQKIAQKAKNLNLQLAVHAIGDRANREVMNVYENVFDKNLAKARWRIEHAQHLNPKEIQRMGDLGIIASMQSIHCTSDASFVEKRIGEKRAEEGAYKWQTLLHTGANLAEGTDAPIESVNPFANLYAAVTRKPENSDSAFYPDEKLSRIQALELYTQANAFAGFQENWKGKIQENYVADIVILDKNLLTCSDQDILKTQVNFTILNGKIVYQKE